MNRKKSVTTRIHQPPAPPCWFRTIFYLSFCSWIVLQAADEYYTITCLQSYTHLPVFENEKRVDSAFLIVVSVGILTVLLVFVFVYGICAVSKLVVLASAAFLATLLILDILAVGILMSSRFSLDKGPVKRGQRVMTIYHKNVSKEHWHYEIKQWAVQFPLGKHSNTLLPLPTTPSSAPAATAGAGADRNADGSDGTASAGTATSPAVTGAGTPAPPASMNATATSPAAGSTADDSLVRRAWETEHRTLYLLAFFQRHGYCCGVDSVEDYIKQGAQTPPSCRCREEGRQFDRKSRPPCSARAHPLADGATSAVWSSGCMSVKQEFLRDLYYLRDLLVATAAFQSVVTVLGVVLGLNMPDSSADDSDDEGGDY